MDAYDQTTQQSSGTIVDRSGSSFVLQQGQKSFGLKPTDHVCHLTFFIDSVFALSQLIIEEE